MVQSSLYGMSIYGKCVMRMIRMMVTTNFKVVLIFLEPPILHIPSPAHWIRINHVIQLGLMRHE